jgi:hypothetical protein
MRLVEEILLGWVVGFILPKSIIIPIFRGMYRSMRETERLDAAERDAALRFGGEGDGGAPVRRFRPGRRPRRPRPGGPMLQVRARKPRNPA